MRFYWYTLIPAFALGGLNVMYDAWPRGGRSMASVERECISKFTGGGYDRAQSKAVCGCLVDKASDWRDANPDAEYTREIHTGFGMTCVNSVGLSQTVPAPRSGPRPPVDPVLQQRLNGGGQPGAAPEPSDWGGQGFVEEGGWPEE